MHINTTVALKTNFMSSLFAVLCCIYLNTHIIQSLFKFEIFIIKIPNDSPFILLVLNFAVFITVYHVKAGQDDTSEKNCSHLIA